MPRLVPNSSTCRNIPALATRTIAKPTTAVQLATAKAATQGRAMTRTTRVLSWHYCHGAHLLIRSLCSFETLTLPRLPRSWIHRSMSLILYLPSPTLRSMVAILLQELFWIRWVVRQFLERVKRPSNWMHRLRLYLPATWLMMTLIPLFLAPLFLPAVVSLLTSRLAVPTYLSEHLTVKRPHRLRAPFLEELFLEELIPKPPDRQQPHQKEG